MNSKFKENTINPSENKKLQKVEDIATHSDPIL